MFKKILIALSICACLTLSGVATNVESFTINQDELQCEDIEIIVDEDVFYEEVLDEEIIEDEEEVRYDTEEVRYADFRETVTSQSCKSNEIFVYGDEGAVSEENLEKLQKQIDKFGGKCGFYVVTLDGKFSIGYNIDLSLPAASTVKAPFSLYAVKQIESGNGTFEEMFEYQKKHYHEGSGVIQNYKYGTMFSLEEIVYHTINVSDNTGYYMLQDRFGISGYNDYLEEVGCSNMKLTGGLRWGYIVPRESALIWNEIYNYSKKSEYGAKLFDMFVNAEYNFVKNAYLTEYDSLDYEIAHKSGFYKDGRHDTAIVLLEDTPYFITIITKPDGHGRDKTYFNNTALILEDIMNEYASRNSN